MRASRTLFLTCAIVALASTMHADGQSKSRTAKVSLWFTERSQTHQRIGDDLHDLWSSSIGLDKEMANNLSVLAIEWSDRLEFIAELFGLASDVRCQADETLVLARVRGRAKYFVRLLDADVKLVNHTMGLIDKPALAEQARVLRDGLHGTREALVAASK